MRQNAGMVKTSDKRVVGREKTEQRAYRLPTALIARVRAYQEREQAKLPPGVTMSETAAVVALLTLALDAAEKRRK